MKRSKTPEHGVTRAPASLLLALLVTFVGGCADLRSETDSLCSYGNDAMELLADLHASGLQPPSEDSSPEEVAQIGRRGDLLIGQLLNSWRRLDPPLEAQLWHDSMEEWLTAVGGSYAILSAAEGKPQSEVTRMVGRIRELMEGLGYEGNQLVMQSDRLFAECP